jgi:hypothetical protein
LVGVKETSWLALAWPDATDPRHSLAHPRTSGSPGTSTVAISLMERAAPRMNKEIPDAAQRAWGLDSRQNTKPSLILHADGQQSVSRSRAPRPRPFASVGAPWAIPFTFSQNRRLPSPGTRSRLWLPYPWVGANPPPRSQPDTPEDPQIGAGPRDPGRGAETAESAIGDAGQPWQEDTRARNTGHATASTVPEESSA